MQETLLFWLIDAVFLAEADSCLAGDEIPYRLCNLKVTATAPYSESAEFNPNRHARLLQELDGRH
jgi:hypothetical protein